jgi:RND family efflux transporter MFP subunit
MKKFINYLTFGLLCVFLFSCGNKDNKSTNDAVKEVFTVKVQKIEEKEIDNEIEVNATVESFKKINLVPTNPGKIEKIYVDVGSNVKEGDLIAEMDQTQFNTTKLQLEQLEKDFKRMDSLNRLGAISNQQYEQFKTNYEVTKNNYKFLEKNVFLKSPISGIITAKYYNEGEMFSAAPNTKDGKAALVTIEQISTLKAFIDLPETYLTYIKPKMKVDMIFSVFSNEIFEAYVNQIYPTVDPLTKTFRVELIVPNNNNKLKPGMFAIAKINLGKIKTLMVPSIAVQKLQGTARYYIFKNENNIAKQIFVIRQKIQDNYTFIISNELKPGDEIVVVGQEKLVDGSNLKCVQ